LGGHELGQHLAGRLIRRRLVQALPIVLIVLTANFLLLRLAPGDAVDAYVAGLGGGADAVQIAELRARWGLDRPVWEQLALFLWRMLTLDLGTSYIYNQPVGLLILERLPATLLLMSSGICFAFSLGLMLGVAAARRAGTWADTALVAFALVSYAMPGFWLGLMMIVVFAVKLAWLPLGGLGTLGSELTGIARVLDVARHLVMPTIAVSLIYLAIYLRLMRAGMLEIYGLDFVRTARAKGLGEGRIAWRHVARNALLPMVTMLGLQFSALFGGSVVVESVFSLPGIGRLAYDSVVARDLNTLLAIIFVSTIVVILVNLAVDLIYARLDPRIAS
jgi:peptide/nickel transport system permease protein